ncbi:MAG: endonuclease NucS domain-containing protein [Luteolibacter sp.]
MPIQHAIWKVGTKPEPLTVSKLATEKHLEDMIVECPAILSGEWMLIGRQEKTQFGGIIDLLAIAPDGSLVLVELKRDKTPREIVAQSLDYASWVEGLAAEKISQIYERFSNGGNLDEAFKAHFGTELDEESLNQSHQIIIVASELDAATERIIGYLNARDLAINAIFFQVFEHGADKLLSRAWLIDPGETQANVVTATKTKGEKEPWNGEFYVSFGDSTSRSWEDAMKYGFISGGGGTWYSQTLKMLSPGDRVWVKIPKTGYVGVGVVTEAVQSVNDFTVTTPDGEERPAMEVLAHRDLYKLHADDPEKAEYFVKVDWLDKVPAAQAINEVGLFGNQNTVCQPTAQKWRYTVDKLKTRFPHWDAEDRRLRNLPFVSLP